MGKLARWLVAIPVQLALFAALDRTIRDSTEVFYVNGQRRVIVFAGTIVDVTLLALGLGIALCVWAECGCRRDKAR
ncbi:MAG: hypothetical protein ACHRHE_16780 [Tepidisphaerales bacterium]